MKLAPRLLAYLSLCISTPLFAFKLEETNIEAVHTAISNQQLSCEGLVSAYINRIKLFNFSVTTTSAPINAITEINRSALADARVLDHYFTKTKKLAGSLHCIPVILKDNVDTFDMTTTAGSYALLGNQPVRDAFLVTQLRKAGAIILAKAGMDEFAWGTSGISSRSGRIGNAYNANKNPGGSSGGSAAAVSANFALVGIGSDNSGSVRIPAAFNGLVGLRPSTGLISQAGIFPMGKIDGIAGPMARNVADLAQLLDVIARPDPQDKKTFAIPRPKTYTAYLKVNGLQHKRIGIVRRVGNVNTFKNMPQQVKAILEKSYLDMQNLGATFVNIDLIKFDVNRDFNQANEIKDINHYLASYPATRKSFQDICESNRTRTFGTIENCLAFMNKINKQPASDIERAYALFQKNKMYVERVMQAHQLDALLIPISTEGNATYNALAINTWQAPVSSNTGMPSIAFNIGYLDHMPVGIELVAKQYAEPTLIEMVYAYEINHIPRAIPVMPPANQQLINYSIPQINNNINLLDQKAYEEILIKNQKNDNPLTPKVFQKIMLSVLLGKN